ncbi:UNVERIFIED_CONTAM: hypothetical protein RMT77_019489 [Armadillidium vulgare]
MTLVQDNPSSALQEKKESQGLISIQSMVTCPIEEDIFEYPPIQENSPSADSSDEAISSNELLEQVASKLERQKSCESVGSMSDESSNTGGDDSHDDDDDGREEEEEDDNLKKDPAEVGCERSTSVVSDASEEGGRDSGIEAEKDSEVPLVIPDEGLMEKIVSQVEFYFSDANVVKDKFLLKHIRRNKEGFVSLKLVSSFKKVKQLTKDWRVVAYSLGKVSQNIQINEQKTKIRRIQPLPEIDDTPVTCAVLALDIPLEKPSVESVSKLFGSVGEISFVRVLRAGGNLPSDIKSLLTKYPVLGEKHCAWIEFETPEAAKVATEMSVEEGMKVVLIVPESQKKQEKLNQHKQQSNSRKNSANSNNGNSNNNNNKYKPSNSRKSSGNYNYYNNYKPRKDSSGHYEPELRRPMHRRKAISLPSAQNPYLNDQRKTSDPRKIRPKSKSCTEFLSSGSPPTSWVQRHLLAAAAASAASAASPVIGSRPPNTRVPRISVGSLPLSEGVIRFPKGPDGTKGFGGFSRDARPRKLTETSSS